MAGGMFASHYESGGEIVEINGKLFKQFYGMSSGVAMNKHAGGVAEYRSSEGKAVTLPYRGMIKDTINDILGETNYHSFNPPNQHTHPFNTHARAHTLTHVPSHQHT